MLILVETYTTLLKKDLRKNLFQLFTSWAGSYSKFLGPFSPLMQTLQANDSDEELQYAALQAMSAIAYCGSCFAPGALSEEGFFYPWLQELLSSSNDRVYFSKIICIIFLWINMWILFLDLSTSKRNCGAFTGHESWYRSTTGLGNRQMLYGRTESCRWCLLSISYDFQYKVCCFLPYESLMNKFLNTNMSKNYRTT